MPAQTNNATHAKSATLLRSMLRDVLGGNAFYRPILHAAGIDNANQITLNEFVQRVPLTTKSQLVEDQLAHPPYGRNLSFPIERYTRFCQTSGTTGRPLRVLDTNDSWRTMLGIWQQVFKQAGCTPGDRAFFAFSFGPFLGFWTAFEAATQFGMLCLPGGGMSSASRLAAIIDNRVTTVCCTPTYAMHLIEVAEQEGINLAGSTVRRLIVAGEPGGSLPAVRQRIEAGWGAKLYDHHGMTEVGPVTYQDNEHEGCLRIAEGALIAEVIDPATLEPLKPGERGELVLTTLLRTAWPLLRYRTGDLVCQDASDPWLLVGGILGRVDDMRLVRGVNIYPSAVDAIIRRFDEVAEYQVEVITAGAMSEIAVVVEPAASCGDSAVLCKRVGQALRDALSLRVPVTPTEPGSLPRYEFKASRWREVT